MVKIESIPTLNPVEEQMLINIEYTYFFDNRKRDEIIIYTQLFACYFKKEKNQLNLKKRKNSIAYIY